MTDPILYTLTSMDGDLNKINASLQRLATERVWQRLRGSSNSVGNLCLHLAGAEYQRISSAIGGKPLIRERSVEFTTEGGLSADELFQKLQSVREQSRTVLGGLKQEELDREIPMYFQPDDWKRMYQHRPGFNDKEEPAYRPQPIAAILLGLAVHYSYHTGQIVMLTKLLQDGDEPILQWKH